MQLNENLQSPMNKGKLQISEVLLPSVTKNSRNQMWAYILGKLIRYIRQSCVRSCGRVVNLRSRLF